MRLAYTYESPQQAASVPLTPEQFAGQLGPPPPAGGSRDELVAWARAGWSGEFYDALVSVLQPGERILSVGSGRARHEMLLVLDDFDVTASDVNVEGLHDAARACPGLRVRQLDVFAPDLSEQYDVVLLGALDYAFDDENLERMLRSARRLLTPAGRILLVHSYLDSPATRLVDLLQPVWAAVRRRGGHELVRSAHGWRRSRRDLVSLAERSGLAARPVAHAGLAVELMRLGIDLKLPRLHAWLRRLDGRLHVLNTGTIFELTPR